ncbi:hypothetical protein [Rhodococcus sp. 27YEA15]|uniref:hypothetical protein n=1 Tax=Rhodococcus sp. 27YEA15 TaxID=3156259 RepID=UPI003C7CAFF8
MTVDDRPAAVTTHRRRSGRGRRFAVGGAALVLAAAVAAVAVVFVGGRSDSSRTVAIVNSDAGAEMGGKQLRAGDALVDTLRGNSDYDFDVLDAPGADKLATLTIPADFSEAVASMLGSDPRQAVVDLDVHGSDPDVAAQLSKVVSAEVGAGGVKGLLDKSSATRTLVDGNLTTAQILVAGTGVAKNSIGQITAGADKLLPYLETARSGSEQLTDVANEVSAMVAQVAGPAQELATRADSLGLTLGEVSSTTAELKNTVDSLQTAMAGLPVPPEIGAQLTSVSSDLAALNTQLGGVPGLVGGGVGEQTEIGDVVRSAVGLLESASGQLTSAAGQLADGIIPIADQAPELLGSVTAQISQGFTTLDGLANSLVTGLNGTKTSLGAMTTPQQVQLASVLSDPVLVNRSASGGGVADDWNWALIFGIATVVLGIALLTQTAAPLFRSAAVAKKS